MSFGQLTYHCQLSGPTVPTVSPRPGPLLEAITGAEAWEKAGTGAAMHSLLLRPLRMKWRMERRMKMEVMKRKKRKRRRKRNRKRKRKKKRRGGRRRRRGRGKGKRKRMQRTSSK
jgi:hypothetical protein